MSIEEIKTLFRDRERSADWQRVLEEFKKYSSGDGNFYMFAANKETNKETRSRFLTYAEAMEVILYEIEKSKVR
jgi:hypothetical protein